MPTTTPGPSPDFDIVMVGHFAKDRLVVDGVTEVASGGAIYYGSIALRQIGVDVAVVTRMHPDDFPLLADLEQAGVKVFATSAPATSGIENIYNSADMERRTCKLIAFAGAFQNEEIPDVSPHAYLVTPIIAGEIDLPLLKFLSSRGPVGLDIQGFVRVPENGHHGGELVFPILLFVYPQ